MSNFQYKYDIHERIFQFVIDVIQFLSELPKNTTNLIFINQITRSITSMGANDQEADGALTKKDFLHNYTTVRKEGKESLYWLRLIRETNKESTSKINNLISEGNEIVLIVSSIINNASLNKKDRK